MKVSFIMPPDVWRPSGSHRVVFEYANGLVSRGHDVTISFVLSRESHSAGVGAFERVSERVRRALRSPRPSWFALDSRVNVLRLRGSIEGGVPPGDALVATWWALAGEVSALPASRGRKFYLVHHYEGHKYQAELIDRTLNLPMKKIAVSNATLGYLRKIGVKDVICIPNGIDQQKYRLVTPSQSRSPFRVAMNFVPKRVKDPQTGIAALRLARLKIPELEPIFFGSARRDRSIPAWVQYIRNPTDDRLVQEIYNSAATFICSSQLEGFGLPAAEAMSCGCALISTACGGVEDYTTDGVSGLLSRVGDAQGLAQNLIRVTSDNQFRQRLALEGRRRISVFTWERAISLLEETLFT